MSGRRERLGLVLFGIAVFVVTVLGVGVRATYGAQTTADEPQYLLSAISLWEDGDLDISDELASERYRDFHEVGLPPQTRPLDDGSRISPHDPLLPVLLAAPTGVAGWMGAKVALAVLAGGLAVLTAWTARSRFGVSTRSAYLAAGVFALAPPLAVFATQVYPALPAALALLAGFAAVVGPFERRGRVVFVISVVALPWLAIKYVPVAAVLAVAGLVKAGRGRRAGLVSTFVVAGAVYVAGHLAIYGGLTPYATGDHFVGGELTVVGTDVDLWGRSTRLIGLLVDRGFGIAAWQPAFFLLPLAAGWAVSSRHRGSATAIWLVGTGWTVATFVALTMHGWWFPGRQVVVVLPIAVLLIASWADEAPWRQRALAATGGLGVAAFGFLLIEGLAARLTWVVDFGATLNPFYRALTTVLPDYMTPTATTWSLHALWVVVVLGFLWAGWWSATSSPGEPPVLGVEQGKRDRERVST